MSDNLQRKDLQDALDVIAAWASGPVASEDLTEVKKQVTAVLQDHHMKQKVFLAAVAKTEMRKLVTLLTSIQGIEDLVLSEESVLGMKDKDRVSLYKALLARMKLALEVLNAAADVPDEMDFSTVDREDPEDSVSYIPPDKRTKIAEMLARFKTAKKVGGEK